MFYRSYGQSCNGQFQLHLYRVLCLLYIYNKIGIVIWLHFVQIYECILLILSDVVTGPADLVIRAEHFFTETFTQQFRTDVHCDE